MTDEQYLERINALDDTLRRCHSDCVALLSYAIEQRQQATDELRKKEFRRDSVRLDKIRDALNKANVNMERID
ncbi:hypothetical protein P9A30_gp38 [Sphingomonas phage Lucius]|uniref:Uncharacterized protein n=1 Tax=Sphingomonas phage Lucius TaxID=2686313 RepID=A0A6M3T8G1_9CAUD|nr:hypothetical protein P9A30_gp38 [Sphingomonas phage Lucius]QJD54480.1 hypothetical protein [Sphingomonas phage Lucius]